MPNINFNVPFVSESGERIQRLKYDQKKIQFDQAGNPKPQPMVDADGNAVHEDIQIKDLLVQILQIPQSDDKDLSFDDRARRGKLARKIMNNSTAHYTDAEIQIIQEYARRGGTITLLAQLDDLLRGVTNDSAAA